MSKKVILKGQVLATEEFVEEKVSKIIIKETPSLSGTYKSDEAGSGFTFAMDNVNALLAAIAGKPRAVQITLVDSVNVRGYKVVCLVGFTNSDIEEVTFEFTTQLKGTHFRHYGTAQLTNGCVTADVIVTSSDYNG